MIPSTLFHWPDSMLRACWQGGLAILLAVAICAILPRISPGLRCWLWRLAYLKLILALFILPSLCLPLLPAAPHHTAVMPLSTGEDASLLILSNVHSTLARSASPLLHTDGFSPASFLLFAWLFGIAGCILYTALEFWKALRLKHRCTPEADPQLLADYKRLCDRLHVRRAPDLLITPEAGSPFLLGGWVPAILLPAHLRTTCTPEELRLMLAHELAHLKRGDLLWGWLAAIAHTLFFFHPLVWMANREWRIAQELACDELTLRITNAPVGDYGAILLKVAAQSRPAFQPGLAAVSASEFPQTLRRRLIAMKSIKPLLPFTRRRLLCAGTLLTGVATVSLLPWRVVAQPDNSQPTAKSKRDLSDAKSQTERTNPELMGRLQEIGEKLDLTANQKSQLRAIYFDLQKQARDIKTDPSATPENREKRISALRQSVERRIKALLTPDQLHGAREFGIMQVFFPSEEHHAPTIEEVEHAIVQISDLMRQVGLTPTQTLHTKQILATSLNMTSSLFNDPTLTQEQRMMQIKQLHQTLEHQLQALLTPDQQQKLVAVKEQRIVDMALDKAQERVGLSKSQLEQIRPIALDLLDQMRSIRDDASLSGPEKEAQLKDAMATAEDDLQTVLTPDQFKKFQEIGGVKGLLVGFAAPIAKIKSEIGRAVEEEIHRLERAGLTDAQRANMNQILIDTKKHAADILSDPSLNHEQQSIRLDDLHRSLLEQLHSILTPDQNRKLEEPSNTP